MASTINDSSVGTIKYVAINDVFGHDEVDPQSGALTVSGPLTLMLISCL